MSGERDHPAPAEPAWLAARFDEARGHLRAVALRMLGSASEADDAVQEAWLKVSRADVGAVANLGGWLTTVVARVCLDQLRARRSRREASLAAAPVGATNDGPAAEQALAAALGPALLVVLELLTPAERVAFVLHDLFELSFDDIAPIVERTAEATRQLASRARRRLRGATSSDAERARERELVAAFLAASRDGDLGRLVAVLAPDVVLRADPPAVATAAARAGQGAPDLAPEQRGAAAVAGTFVGRARGAQPALIDGQPGAVWMGGGQVRAAFLFVLEAGAITGIELVMEPGHLAELSVTTA